MPSIPTPAVSDLRIEDLRRGDENAWSQTVRQLAPALTGYARSRGVPDPEDFTQDVLLAVAQRVDRFTGNWDNFRTWVFSIAYRQAADRHRRHYRTPRHVELTTTQHTIPCLTTPEQELVDQETSRAAVHALRILKPVERDIITLRVIGELSTEQVAAAVGKTPGAVRTIQSRATAKLRQHLEREHDHDKKNRNAGPVAAITAVNMRQLLRTSIGHPDPFAALPASDPLAGWMDQLQAGTITPISSELTANLAGHAALAVPVAATSLITGAGVTAAALTEGITMIPATTATSLLGVKTMVAGILSAVTVTAGAAAGTGHLPEPAQSAAANVAAKVGIELPHTEQVTTVDVASAGQVTVGVRDGQLKIVDVEAAPGWQASIGAQSAREIQVDMMSEHAEAILTAALDQAGEVTAEVTTRAAAEAVAEAEHRSDRAGDEKPVSGDSDDISDDEVGDDISDDEVGDDISDDVAGDEADDISGDTSDDVSGDVDGEAEAESSVEADPSGTAVTVGAGVSGSAQAGN